MIIDQKRRASSGPSRPELYFFNYSRVKDGIQIQHNQEKSLTMTENHQNVTEMRRIVVYEEWFLR